MNLLDSYQTNIPKSEQDSVQLVLRTELLNICSTHVEVIDGKSVPNVLDAQRALLLPPCMYICSFFDILTTDYLFSLYS